MSCRFYGRRRGGDVRVIAGANSHDVSKKVVEVLAMVNSESGMRGPASMTRTIAEEIRVGQEGRRGTFGILRKAVADYETREAIANDSIVVGSSEVGGGGYGCS